MRFFYELASWLYENVTPLDWIGAETLSLVIHCAAAATLGVVLGGVIVARAMRRR